MKRKEQRKEEKTSEKSERGKYTMTGTRPTYYSDDFYPEQSRRILERIKKENEKKPNYWEK